MTCVTTRKTHKDNYIGPADGSESAGINQTKGKLRRRETGY